MKLKNNKNFKLLRSLRFEYYLTLLKHSNFIIGNSSSGMREAPVYGVPTINLGNRQKNRNMSDTIINCSFDQKIISNAINKVYKIKKTGN